MRTVIQTSISSLVSESLQRFPFVMYRTSWCLKTRYRFLQVTQPFPIILILKMSCFQKFCYFSDCVYFQLSCFQQPSVAGALTLQNMTITFSNKHHTGQIFGYIKETFPFEVWKYINFKWPERVTMAAVPASISQAQLMDFTSCFTIFQLFVEILKPWNFQQIQILSYHPMPNAHFQNMIFSHMITWLTMAQYVFCFFVFFYNLKY